MITKPKRPADEPTRKTGRPAINPDGGETPVRKIRIDDARWDKCNRLGGAQWIRDRIDETPDPGESPEPSKRHK